MTQETNAPAATTPDNDPARFGDRGAPVGLPDQPDWQRGNITAEDVVEWIDSEIHRLGLEHAAVHVWHFNPGERTITWTAYRAGENETSGKSIEAAAATLPGDREKAAEHVADLEAQLAEARRNLDEIDRKAAEHSGGCAPTPDPCLPPSLDYPAGSQVNIDRNSEVARLLK